MKGLLLHHLLFFLYQVMTLEWMVNKSSAGMFCMPDQSILGLMMELQKHLNSCKAITKQLSQHVILWHAFYRLTELCGFLKKGLQPNYCTTVDCNRQSAPNETHRTALRKNTFKDTKIKHFWTTNYIFKNIPPPVVVSV